MLRTETGLIRASRFDIALYGLLAVAGTAVRFAWCERTMPWLSSVDSRVWSLLLNAPGTGVTLDQLAHFPHEPGGMLFGLLALPLPMQIGAWPALNVVILGVEMVSLFGMMWCAHLVFGRRTASWFAVWAIAATPLMLGSSVIPAGMHAHAAFWPMLGLILVRLSDRIEPRVVGALCALSLTWSLDNGPLVLWVLTFTIWTARSRAGTLKSWSAGFVVAVLPLVLLRVFGDFGFQLQGGGLTWIRGLDLSPVAALGRILNLPLVWLHPVPGSSLLPGTWLRVAWAVLIYGGIAVSVLRNATPETRWGAGLLIGFVSVYAVSPVYEAGGGHDTMLAYRHLAYITPLMALLALHGFSQGPNWIGRALGTSVVLLGVYGGVASYNRPAPDVRAWSAPTGTLLAWKLGHDVPRLLALLEWASLDSDSALVEGLGAGYASAVLPTSGVPKLISTLRQHPVEHHAALTRGVESAFEPTFIPQLPTSLLPQVLAALDTLYVAER